MKNLFTLLIISAVIFGCSSGKKALEQGDYDRAVTQAVNRLQKKPDHKKARNTLNKAYYYALNYHHENIERYKAEMNPFKWEKVVTEYQRINNMSNQVRRCPACLKEIPRPTIYTTELNNARSFAAQKRYELGDQAMRFKNNRNKAIEAHQHYTRANQLISSYKDVRQKIEEALYYATLRVVVEDIPSPTRAFQLNQDFFTNKVNEYLHRQQTNPYVQFLTPAEARGRQDDWVDHVIRMEFDRFNIGNVTNNKFTEEVTRDSVILTRRNNEPIYGTVKARLTVHEKSVGGSGLLDFQIRDLNLNRVITQEKFPSSYDWSIRWATFNGDERALSEEQLDMVNRVEMDIPGPQRMFEEFAAPLYDQVIRKINSYYRNY